MLAFPTTPVDPSAFFEETIPALFAEVVSGIALDDTDRSIELRVGVVLLPDDSLAGDCQAQGGEWTLHLADGDLAVLVGRASNCDLTIVQRVADWRSALWEGRPRLISDAVAAVVSAGPEALRSAEARDNVGHPTTLKGFSDLQGLIEAVIADEAEAAEGASAEDWKVGVYLGRGPIPESPQATIRLGAEQAEAMRRGELHPIEALITGQLRLEGDLGLILQLQAVAMMISRPPSTRSPRF
jgi:hypothetical protein